MRTIIYDEDTKPLNLVGRTPTVINKSMASQNTEYDQDLPADTVKFTLQARGANDIKLAFTSGNSGTTYITIKSGASYTEDLLGLEDTTLYMQSPDNTVVAEIVAWTR